MPSQSILLLFTEEIILRRPCLNLLPLKRRDLWSDPATRLSESSLKLPPKINAKLSFNLCQGLRLLQFPKSYSTIATSPVVSLDADPEKGDREEMGGRKGVKVERDEEIDRTSSHNWGCYQDCCMIQHPS